MKIFRFFYFLVFTTIFFSSTTHAEDFSGAFRKEFKIDDLEYTIIIPEKTIDFQDFERIHLNRSADEYNRIKSFYEKFTPCIITISNKKEDLYNTQKDEFIRKIEQAGHFEALQHNPSFKNIFFVLNSSMLALFPIMLTSLTSAKLIDNLIPENIFFAALIMTIIIAPIHFSLQTLNDLRYLPNGYQNKNFKEIINGTIREKTDCDLIRVGNKINSDETFVTVRFIKKEHLENVKDYINKIHQEFEAQNPCGAQ